MADEAGEGDSEFLRSEDMICLNCTTAAARESASGDRVCLAAEGFGNRMCFLQSMAKKGARATGDDEAPDTGMDLPFDISVCVFVLEQALSVRALQEMVSSTSNEGVSGQSGHRTLLYGHAVLLRHSHSNMYLSCLSTQSSQGDKLAFDVGLKLTAQGESCWWTIHPASKQRSEGEKVRVGDDLILVSVASERYLHIGLGQMVIASFQQTLWTVQPVSSGIIRQKSVGYVFGGDVLRLLHGDEVLTIPQRDAENVTSINTVMYETGSVSSHARSLWKLEHTRTKWAEGFMDWGQTCRMRHVTSGRYLAVGDDNNVVTFHRAVATEDATAFILRQSKDDRKVQEGREDEGMGTADIKYGDSLVYIQHARSGLWLSYQTFETKKRGVGRVEEKKAIVMVEGHMDDGLTFSRSQAEEDRSARVIRKCTSLIARFIKALESLKTEGRSSKLWEAISLGEVIMTLEDLIEYFAQPADDLDSYQHDDDFEERQVRLKALRNRQDLFQEEGMIALILETIDRCSQWKSMRHLAHLIGEDGASKWNDMISYLYLLLAAMIRGNHANCSQFAAVARLDWLVDRLDSSEQSSTGVLDVLHCVLVDSPEALNVIKEQHIRTIISLIDKQGRDSRVLNVLCALCVGNNVAVRSNQNLICDNLLPRRDLLLQTKVIDAVYSMHPNIYVGYMEGSAMYTRWYYEAIVDHVERVTEHEPIIRVGWANTEGFIPYPGGGEGWGSNGVGDCLYSYAFDGINLWTAGSPKLVRTTQQTFQRGDVIGCLLDLSVPQMTFTVNGIRVKGFFRDFNLDGMFYPVISMSSMVSIRFMLGGEHGKLKYGPPEGHSPVYESLLPRDVMTINPCFQLGDLPKGIITGPRIGSQNPPFVPHPVDTMAIQLPTYIDNCREKLAENIHEMWAVGKIEQGWIFNDFRDDTHKYHPCLTSFERLPANERAYNLSLAYETLRTLIALGYHVAYDPQYTQNNRIRTIKLNNNYLQAGNGYKPAPLDLSSQTLNNRMMELVELLAENTHNVWAKERIKQGWTYGLTEDPYSKRSPHLVPYVNVDETIKSANRQTSSEMVKTLMMYGYSLEPPTNELGETGVSKDKVEQKVHVRTYRAELNRAVESGKWYYEFEVLTPGYMKCGWAKVSAEPSVEIGVDGSSYAFDGFVGRKWCYGSVAYGKVWQKGDIIGCMLDITDKTISFSLNGELMMDRMGQEIAFKGIETSEAFVPAFSLFPDQLARLNFGQDVDSLKFFTCCGLQEGYQPFCVNMTQIMPLWYAKEQALFETLKNEHPRLEFFNVLGGSTGGTPPCMKVHSTTYGTLEATMFEFLRLSLPVRCQNAFKSPKEKLSLQERLMNAENLQRGGKGADIHEEEHVSRRGARGLFKKRGPQKSLEDAEPSPRPGLNKQNRRSSETDLTGDFMLDVPQGTNTISASTDGISTLDDDAGSKPGKKSKERGKSPFGLFKKGKSRDASPTPHARPDRKKPYPSRNMAPSSSEYSEESEAESVPHGKPIRKTKSDASYDSEAMDSETDVTAQLEEHIDLIDEYYYGLRILPGQDPNAVYVGWITPRFHMYNSTFDIKSIRNAVLCTLDYDNKITSSVSRKNCYIVSAGELQHRYGQHEDSGKRRQPGLLIGCHIDTSTGGLSFSVNGKEVANKFQVEPGTLLFPAVFFEPTNKEVLQFELGREKHALPLSAVLFRGGKHLTPQCPPRLELQYLNPFQWSRVPITSNRVHCLKLSDIRGWSMLIEDPVPRLMSIYIPEEDRSLDILALQEMPEFLKFHAHTLELYRCICSHGNHRVAHELTKHVDQYQMQNIIQSKYMPGDIRIGYHNLLISMHLDSHTTSRQATQHEFIIPLAQGKQFQLFRPDEDGVKATIPSLAESVSVRPVIDIEQLRNKVNNEEQGFRSSPFFDLQYLKERMMYLLNQAVENGGAHIRDPLGGTNETLFVPLLRVVDNLLLMGLLDDADLDNLLILIDPASFDPLHNKVPDTTSGALDSLIGGLATGALPVEVQSRKQGMLQIKLADPVKLELCKMIHHLCDIQLRHRVEAIVGFADGFVKDLQVDQLRRYNEIKQADIPPALAARKTREFRCPADQQMKATMAFHSIDLENFDSTTTIECPCKDDLRDKFHQFHQEMLNHAGHQPPVCEDEGEDSQAPVPTFKDKLLALIASKEEEAPAEEAGAPDTFQKLIIATVIRWAKSEFIQDQELIRQMFGLLHRQYDAIEELQLSINQAYVISQASKDDIRKLLMALGAVRALLPVQVAPDEEEILKSSIWELADNKVFFQHPDLMRALAIHETVMQLMVNTLNKAQHQTVVMDAPARSSDAGDLDMDAEEAAKDSAADMVVACCRFLCYFCRTGRRNQRSMFDHLSYLLDNSCMLLSRPSLRGSCPLDVAYSSLMDNNELALGLREADLDKVAAYLCRSGQQSNQDLISKGYPDLGWDPVEGERFLDFFRFCVWVNGESVEENANLVVRLLIRRPECLGPALRGEGGGLLKAMENGILMSMQIAAARDQDTMLFLQAVTATEDDERGNFLIQNKFDFSTLPPEDDEDYIDMGGAILNFYSSLADLLGRCAPDAETIKAGRSDSLRARAILRSLVSMEDLEGVLGLRFILPQGKKEEVVNADGEVELVSTGSMPPGLQAQHKTAVVLFLERVYGVPDQATLFRLLEDGFLPDLRAATTLDDMVIEDSDVALALNRYICTAVLPLLDANCDKFLNADHGASLLDSTLHTVYRLSQCRCLTKNQRDIVSDFLVSFTSQLRPPMMTSLLRKLVLDVPSLNENSIVPLRVLTNHYDRCGLYYGSKGWGAQGTSTEEEKRLTMMLFSGIFDSLAKRAYDPELFSKALPCLSAIACALPPDYSLSNQDTNWIQAYAKEMNTTYDPNPVDISRIRLDASLHAISVEFAEHYHDSWAMNKMDEGWTLGTAYDLREKKNVNLKSFKKLADRDQKRYLNAVEEAMKAMLAWGWNVEIDSTRAVTKSQIKHKISKTSMGDYTPRPADLRNVTLTRAMLEAAERVAENSHDRWAMRKKQELDSIGGGIHPQLVAFDKLTDKERKHDRHRAHEIISFLQVHGFRIHCPENTLQRKRDQSTRQSKDSDRDSGVGVSSTEKRFAYSLLEKLLEYVDKAAINMRQTRPATRYSRRNSYSTATEDVKFFGKVVLPLVERYFRAHKMYFITNPAVPLSGSASIKEKEMTASLFSKLALLLRQRITAFGHDVQISVRCLQTLVAAIDARAVVRNSPEIVRSSLLPFFNHAADDLSQTVHNLKIGRFSHVKGTIIRGATSLNFVHMVLLPVLTSMFDHLGRNGFGEELLVGEQQLCCYRILNALYALGTNSSTFVQRDSIMSELTRHRPALGECVASFASTFPVAFLEPQLNMYNKHSVCFGIPEDKIAAHSLEAKEVMDQVAETVPSLEKIIVEIADLAESGGNYQEAPHVIEVTLPMLCSYLPFWWSQGGDNVEEPEAEQHKTTVTTILMNGVLGNVLKLVGNNIGSPEAPWMTRIATRTQPIIVNATADMLKDHILPVAEKLKERSREMEMEETSFFQDRKNRSGDEQDSAVQEHFQILVRDMYAFYPLLIKYVDLHRSHWLKNPSLECEELYLAVAEVFNLWSKSHLYKKEEQNFVNSNEIDNMALIMPSQDKSASAEPIVAESKAKRPRGCPRPPLTSLNVACLKRLLPIGLNMFGGQEQELVQQAKGRLIEKETVADIEDFLRASLTSEEKVDDDETNEWQKQLYKKIGSKKDGGVNYTQEMSITRVLAMAKVLYGLHLVEHPPASMKTTWKKVVSSQRKRAVMACFRMVPLHSYPRHRAINLFMRSYQQQWLMREEPGHSTLIEDITDTVTEEEAVGEEVKEEEEATPQPLGQLITALSRAATIESVDTLKDDQLYISFANIMSQSCHGEEEEEEEGDGPGASMQEQEMEKQKLLSEQGRLTDRGAAEMMLLYISACNGQWSEMVMSSIELGISILRGGNINVQARMLAHLKEKKDVGFFMSIAGLMQQCSVLDLDAFERGNKAEGLGVSGGEQEKSGPQKNLHDSEDVIKLFRFLQLLCEGHNLEFQNYLRTQAGNTTTVNIIISTVDYLLRVQESIMDFYWHYSGKETIDESGKESFFRAINVSNQLFASITEYLQGPCAGNQLALAHSRLWDAVGGFLYIFAHMQDKLSKDPDQLDLLREFMGLQKEMMIMLLSMLEGNVVNGAIGKQMVDTLVESATNFEMILKFFDIFLKMKDLTDADAFKEYDQNGDGVISTKEFRKSMVDQKLYTPEEIDYIMMCVDANQDGKVDFNEFTDRFFNPAKDIGFNVALLLTNLSEHMPNDPRLGRFTETARCVLDYFEPYLGRIEIMGGAERIERVYFEIKQSQIDQWEKPQIKDSKRTFLYDCCTGDGEKEKLEIFIDFCEDTIFEMQHATSISVEEQTFQFGDLFGGGSADPAASPVSSSYSIMEGVKTVFGYLWIGLCFILSCISPSNIAEKYRLLRSMTLKEMSIGLLTLFGKLLVYVLTLCIKIIATLIRFVYNMMIGDRSITSESIRRRSMTTCGAALSAAGYQPAQVSGMVEAEREGLDEQPVAGEKKPIEMFGMTVTKEQGDDGQINAEGEFVKNHDNDVACLWAQVIQVSSRLSELSEFRVNPKVSQQSSSELSDDELPAGVEGDASQDVAAEDPSTQSAQTSTGKAMLNGSAGGATPPPDPSTQYQEEGEATEEGVDVGADLEAKAQELQQKSMEFTQYILSMFARNFYNFKLLALSLAFLINFILLFYKATMLLDESGDEEAGDGGEDVDAGDAGGDDEIPEFVSLAESVSYLSPFLRLLAFLHTFTSFATMVAYFCLKVPLVVFKREKEISRNLEFEGKWISQQDAEEDIMGNWDKLVISTHSFPDKYWDKFVKKKVRNKYAEQYDYDQITILLGMDKDASGIASNKPHTSILPQFVTETDWQYHLWKWGVIFTDNSFLYCVMYFILSVLGNFNYFFFAGHLLDVAVCFKTLGTILQSVTHNGKQLMLTVMLLMIIVYVYSVVAFNFFRKFYIQDPEEEGEDPDYKCHSMFSCYIFHLYVGVRAGGGIGDEIGSPDGDPFEVYRILFDITFFFFIIIILLAIIQGLIIDAFGELRDQMEQVKEDLESACFICGIGKDYFDKVPHGFETHVQNEHNFANYMFFLMHLINKPDTEYTGQESYVWELYQKRSWDFFPVGDCFRKQYEVELGS